MEMINCIRVVVNTFRISSCPPFTDKVPAFPWTFPLQTTGLILYSRALLYNRETDKCIVNLYYHLFPRVTIHLYALACIAGDSREDQIPWIISAAC